MDMQKVSPFVLTALVAVALFVGLTNIVTLQYDEIKNAGQMTTSVISLNAKQNEQEQDKDWYIYQNDRLGFSIEIPRTSQVYGCGNAEGIDVPLKIFEDVDGIYLADEYQLQLDQETGECKRVLESLENLKKERQTWNMVVKTVNNDDEVTTAIKSHYGGACKIASKEEVEQRGVYKLVIQGYPDGPGSKEPNCVINYISKALYYPNGHKLAYWDLGQGPHILSKIESDDLEGRINRSFRFLDK